MKRSSGCAALCLAAASLAAAAADPAKDLLDAAAQGRTARVEELIAHGAPVNARDKDGRTPLMLAAQHGNAGAAGVLLAKGADAAARDREGATAWVLAMFAPQGRGDSEAVLKLLPRPPRPSLAIEASWSPANLYSSCIMQLEQLARLINGFQPDRLAVRDIGAYAGASGRGLVADGGVDALGTGRAGDEVYTRADAVLLLVVKPGAACQAQSSADQLSLTVEVQLVRSRDRAVLLHKEIGAKGLKRFAGRTVTGEAQYLPMYQEWIKPYSEQAWHEAVEAWYRSQ